MINRFEYYKENVLRNNKFTAKLKRQLAVYSLLRLSVFIITLTVIYFVYKNWQVALLVGISGAGIFIYLLSSYTEKKRKQQFHQALIEINEDELLYLDGTFHHKPAGTQFKNPDHFFSEDIDLFGTGSFYQYVNRTSSEDSQTALAELLLANNIDDIPMRQSAIQELSTMTTWRQEFSAYASLINVETRANTIEKWIANYNPFYKGFHRFIPTIFSGLSFVVFGMIYFNVLTLTFLLYWLIIAFLINRVFVKKIDQLSHNADKAKDTIRQYSILLRHIEEQEFTSELLKTHKRLTLTSEKKASILFKEFSTALDTLDNRKNDIYRGIGDGFFLTDIRNSFKVEKWIVQNRNKIKDWFKVIEFFDANNSLGNYVYNHPTYVFPKISNGEHIIKAKALGHPLLRPDKRIDNDIEIKSKEFFIITGANMAGKSTFLRTVSLHIVMANIGLPVCAISSEYNPIKLISSMRTSDSLKDESSYFFAELTRLKYIVDAIKDDSYFIVLDEILKGTNSTDKAIGSRKFVEKLVESMATGIIATHDLSLCEIAKELKEVKNYYFDAEIKNEELSFDYKFQKGICQNMNASFLLKKMKII